MVYTFCPKLWHMTKDFLQIFFANPSPTFFGSSINSFGTVRGPAYREAQLLKD